MIFKKIFFLSLLFTFSRFTFAASSSVSPDDLAILDPATKSNALLLSDSSCGSCSKLIKDLPKICDLKPKSFAVLATGSIKKNKKKLAELDKNFDIYLSTKRGLLTTLKAPATPSLFINQKNFVVGYNAIIKYFKSNSDSFCLDKSAKI